MEKESTHHVTLLLRTGEEPNMYHINRKFARCKQKLEFKEY